MLASNWLGSKRLLGGFLVHNLIKKERFDSVVDCFSGSAFVSHLFKRAGKLVIANDVMKYPHALAEGLIENNTKLFQQDLFGIGNYTPKISPLTVLPCSKERYLQKIYGQTFFTEKENNFIEQIMTNLRILKGKYTNYEVAFLKACLCKMTLARIEHGKFTHTTNLKLREKYKTNLLPIKVHYLRVIEDMNQYIFDNGKCNRAYNENMLRWKDVPDIDLAFVDPPYESASVYETHYFFLEGIMTEFNDWKITFKGKNKSFTMHEIDKDFQKKNILNSFDKIFTNLEHIPKIAFTYNNASFPDAKTITQMMFDHGWKFVSYKETDHRYKQQTTKKGKMELKQVKEYLLIGMKTQDR